MNRTMRARVRHRQGAQIEAIAIVQEMHRRKEPISGSGSEAVSLPCPTQFQMIRSLRRFARCGRRCGQ
jgi:hypothetical protein